MKIITSIPMGGKAVPMQARSRYYPRLADAKLSLRLTARELLSTEARISALHWHRLLHPLHYLLIATILRQLHHHHRMFPISN